ncbi:hypothetical protein RRG08_052507 [Elysia crispata]|uniref:Uncharacterized protein n=1 Tax=Elysia crispata TaxID=231223 RepID=A0AAE1DH18_9GAST|nr:hypothetical protein RRG08_052507 [Elysia crispata]
MRANSFTEMIYKGKRLASSLHNGYTDWHQDTRSTLRVQRDEVTALPCGSATSTVPSTARSGGKTRHDKSSSD